MATTNETAVIDNTNMVLANAFKEKVVLPWVKTTKGIAESKGKAIFKKAASDRLKVFNEFDGSDLTSFGEGGKLSEVARSAWQVAAEAAKADKIGATPMGSLGIGLSLRDEESVSNFKSALSQAVVWASRQVANEAAQAAAKAEAAKAAKAEVEALTKPLFEGEALSAWFNSKASDEDILKASKVLALRASKILHDELRQIESAGSGSVARATELLDFVEDEICGELEQMLSDSTLRLRDKDGSRIWGQPSKLTVGTTARKLIELALIRLSALQSKVDRSLARFNAAKGVGSIEW